MAGPEGNGGDFLSAIALKYLALASMLSDHIYKAFGIESTAMAVFGRLAFPIFCYLSAVGFHKTRSRKNYLLRIFICAIISEIPFDMLWRHTVFDPSLQNVCFTLLLGGIACCVYDAFSKYGAAGRIAGVALASIPVIFAGILHTDYGLFGAGLLFLIFVSDGSRAGIALSVVLFDIALCSSRYIGQGFDLSGFAADIQHFCLLALPFILTASGQKGVREKKSFLGRYYFYIFYPAHMALLALISRVFPYKI